VNTVTVSFNAIMGKTTEVYQRKTNKQVMVVLFQHEITWLMIRHFYMFRRHFIKLQAHKIVSFANEAQPAISGFATDTARISPFHWPAGSTRFLR